VDGTFSKMCPVVDPWVLLTLLENHKIPWPQSAMKCILAVIVIKYLFQLMHACKEKLAEA
jgi:hypothetical protein